MTGPTVLSANERFTRESPPLPWLYRTLRGPMHVVLTRWFDLQIDGLENLPTSGPYLVAANHHNYLDGIVLGVATPAPIAFLVMPRVWRATPLHPMFHRHIRSIPINLERPDVGALRRALHRLQDGGVVGIFPEGPFSVRGRLESGLPGVALLALRSGVPVVPAGIRGTFEALEGRWGYIPRRVPLGVRFGPARRFSAVRAASRRGVAAPPAEARLQIADGANDRRSARLFVTRRIMDDIAALLP